MFSAVVVALRRVSIFNACALLMLMVVFFPAFDRASSMLLGFRRRPSKSRISFISMLRCDLTLKSWCEYFLG